MIKRSVSNQKFDNGQQEIRKRAWVICLLSVFGIYVGIYSPIVTILVFIMSILTLVWFNEQEIFFELLFLLPFTMIYKVNPSSTSLFTVIVLVATIVLLFKNRKISKRILLIIIILSIYMLFGVGNKFEEYFKLLVGILFSALFIEMIKRKNFVKLITSISLGTILSSFIGLNKANWPELANFFSNMKQEYISGVLIFRFTGLYLDPNYFSIIVLLCIFSMFVFVYLKEIDFFVGFTLISILIFFGLLTYSRVFYLSLFFFIVIAFILRIKITRKLFSSIIIISVLFGLGFYLSDKYGIIENITYRFSVADISNNRFYIWENYNKYILSSVKTLFLGDGIKTPYLNGVGPHSFYIELVYYLGILGGSLYIYVYSHILLKKKDFKNNRYLIDYSLPFLLMLMFGTLGMLFSNDFPFIIIVCWIVLNSRSTSISDMPVY